MRTLAALVLCFLCCVPFVSAQNDSKGFTGNDLQEKCKFLFDGDIPSTITNTERVDMGYCAGFLDGTVTEEQVWNLIEGKSSKVEHFCMPNEVTKRQLLLVFKKWLEEHPDALQQQANYILHIAFVKAFPCKKPPTK